MEYALTARRATKSVRRDAMWVEQLRILSTSVAVVAYYHLLGEKVVGRYEHSRLRKEAGEVRWE